MSLLLAALLMPAQAAAQTADESAVILPLEAQTCNLPVAPAKIPDEASYEDLAKAKGNVVKFQDAMVSYRECLDGAKNVDNLTDGNTLALTNAHNYSVEMEERIAEQFNIAVRSYKARQAAQAEK
jgi:hypothetical protein